MLTRSSIVAAALLAFTVGTATTLASNAALAAGDQSGASATTSATDKKAISKSCSDQANAKGLHGKARKKFRAACKHNGGKAE